MENISMILSHQRKDVRLIEKHTKRSTVEDYPDRRTIGGDIGTTSSFVDIFSWLQF